MITPSPIINRAGNENNISFLTEYFPINIHQSPRPRIRKAVWFLTTKARPARAPAPIMRYIFFLVSGFDLCSASIKATAIKNNEPEILSQEKCDCTYGMNHIKEARITMNFFQKSDPINFKHSFTSSKRENQPKREENILSIKAQRNGLARWKKARKRYNTTTTNG